MELGNHQAYDFAVGKRPLRVAGNNLQRLNRQFLASVDSEFFLYFAKAHMPSEKSGPDVRRAGAMLRLCYRLSLETFFAFLFAALQSPESIFSWLNSYKEELRELVDQCHRGDGTIFNQLGIDHVSWQSVTQTIFAPVNADSEMREKIVADLSEAWSDFAADFLEPRSGDEYNSLKHGLRCGFGGFALGSTFTPKDVGTPAGETFTPFGASEHGMYFFKLRRIENVSRADPRRIVDEMYLNWDIEYTLARISVLTQSLKNVLAFLEQFVEKSEPELSFVIPTPEQLKAAKFENVGVPHLLWNSNVDLPKIELNEIVDRLSTIDRVRHTQVLKVGSNK